MMKITKTFFVISLLTIGLLSFGSSYDLVFKMEKDLEKEYKENLDIVFTSSFQERMDELSLAKTEFVMGHLWDLVNRERFLDAEELQDLIALKQKYNDLVKLYGKTEDFKRSSVFKAYVKKSISLIREKRGLGRLKKIGSFSLQGLFRVKYFDLVKDLYDYYSRKNSHRNDIMNPFLRASGNVGEALLKAPIKIEMNGFRFNNDEINVIFMNHPQSKIDNVIVTKVLNSFQGEKIIIANAENSLKYVNLHVFVSNTLKSFIFITKTA